MSIRTAQEFMAALSKLSQESRARVIQAIRAEAADGSVPTPDLAGE